MKYFVSAVFAALVSTAAVAADAPKRGWKQEALLPKDDAVASKPGKIKQDTGYLVPGCTDLKMTNDGKLVEDCDPAKHEVFKRDAGY